MRYGEETGFDLLLCFEDALGGGAVSVAARAGGADDVATVLPPAPLPPPVVPPEPSTMKAMATRATTRTAMISVLDLGFSTRVDRL